MHQAQKLCSRLRKLLWGSEKAMLGIEKENTIRSLTASEMENVFGAECGEEMIAGAALVDIVRGGSGNATTLGGVNNFV